MEKRIFTFFILIIILSIVLCFVSCNLKNKAESFYASTHTEKMAFRNYEKYSEIFTYEEALENWDEEKYISLCNLANFIDSIYPFMIFLSVYSIALTKFIYEMPKMPIT